ncbi:hypothetical protein [Streptomyces sp. NPDC046197]|uniref:hypothetical protein n=1 Tax=Streptomyces sp. NPDC046197 TaxID=3154337 RepID=UPI0033C1BFB8
MFVFVFGTLAICVLAQLGWTLLWVCTPRFDALFRKSPEAALELARRAEERAELPKAVHWLQWVEPAGEDNDGGPKARLVVLEIARFLVAANRIDVLLDVFPPEGEIDAIWKGRALITWTSVSGPVDWEGRPDKYFYARTGILARAQRGEECYLLWTYGMEPDGSPARPWHPTSRKRGLFTDEALPSDEYLGTFVAHHTTY